MLNKKGVGGHVDWIISIGIFLVYLLGMFVLIKPGVIPVHDYDTLLDIMEENIKGDFYIKGFFEDVGGLYWTLYKVPLFVEGSLPSCIKINFPYDISEDKVNVYEMDPNTRQILNTLDRSLSGNSLSIKGVSSTGKYIIYFSDNDAYSGKEISNPTTGDCVSEGFEYNLGIIEKTRGMIEDLFSILNDAKGPEGYLNIKNIYGYPESKEFSIIITKSNGTEYEYKVVEPDAKANVYTRQWSDFILKYDGVRDPIKVNIKVW